MSTSRVDTVVAAIRAYLARHPDAADSVDGISRWWLGGRGGQAGGEEVRCALEQLVSEGVVRERTLPGGERIYAAARPAPGKTDRPGGARRQ